MTQWWMMRSHHHKSPFDLFALYFTWEHFVDPSRRPMVLWGHFNYWGFFLDIRLDGLLVIHCTWEHFLDPSRRPMVLWGNFNDWGFFWISDLTASLWSIIAVDVPYLSLHPITQPSCIWALPSLITDSTFFWLMTKQCEIWARHWDS